MSAAGSTRCEVPVSSCWRRRFFCLAGPAASNAAETAPQVNVAHAILMDAETGTVLFERGADALVDPASTSKIMTAEIVFEMLKAGKLKPDQVFKISQTAWREGGAPSHGTTMFAKPNSDIAVSDLLQGLVVGFRQRCRDRASRGHFRLAGRLRDADDAAGPRARLRAHDLHRRVG